MVEKRGFKKRKQLGSGKRLKDVEESDLKEPVSESNVTNASASVESKDTVPESESTDKTTSESDAIKDESPAVKRRKPNEDDVLAVSAPGPEMLALASASVPKNIRTTTITDFQPDVCKDFLQTGYCGYGDTCKFIHVRNESVQKKPVVRDWEIAVTNGTKEPSSTEIPFKCVLCKSDYNQPVQTGCGHVFCKLCFMDRYKKRKTRCFVCHEETNGIITPYKEKI